ncbi:MAG: HAMP domain-containing histidine kinase [Bacilli bacterium]|nr:HAMP domain-containing histidine kinase [Bacilli bacterium]
MNKLRNKVFWTISLILFSFLVTILLIFNVQAYFNSYHKVEDTLNRMHQGPMKNDIQKRELPEGEEKPLEDMEPPEMKDNNRMFMDAVVYTIEINENKEIEQIISHSESSATKEVKKFATKILSQKDIPNQKIGNLYTTRYAYKYIEGESLIIVDNQEVEEDLRSNLISSIIIFLLADVLIVLIAMIITKWITRPVEESFEKQRQFIADASHELKTPIAVIMSNLETYEVDKKKKWLDNISNETERMSNLIKNLLDLARSENDNKESYTMNNLSKIVEKQSLTFESICFEKNIDLVSNIEDDIKINSNGEELKQLVSIILDNAIKHSPEENGQIRINLSNRNKIVLEISNKGKPFPKGMEEKIFERFYRDDESRNRNDNRYGLGLAIAKNIVIKHNGTIKAYSENGFTTFQITFKK